MLKWIMWRKSDLTEQGWQMKVKERWTSLGWENRFVRQFLAKRWSFVIVLIAFLLGRAMILEQFSPFALAFFAVIYFFRRDLVYQTALALLIGAMMATGGQPVWLAIQLLLFAIIQRGLEKYERADLAVVPVTVFIVSFLVNGFSSMIVRDLSWYVVMLNMVEAVLSFVLTLVFMQAVPIIAVSQKKSQLKMEEIVCLFILLASVMTGTVGWIVEGLSVEHVFSRYFILLFAIVGGAALGSSIGVVTGLILSLANVQALHQIGLLAFAGLLAGLMKEGKKFGVVFGFMLGATILSLYAGDRSMIITSVAESFVAVLLFLLTPRRWIEIVATFVPGTQEHMKNQLDYARTMRHVVSKRIEQFSQVFRQLSASFNALSESNGRDERGDSVDFFMNDIAEKSCSACWKKKKCWEGQFSDTYAFMTGMISALEQNPHMLKAEIHPEWKRHCVKVGTVFDLMKQQIILYQNNLHWKKQIQESRQLVADQLTGVSKVMEDLSREIKKESQVMVLQEEQIREAIEQLGLSIYDVDIINLEEGNIHIEMMHRYQRGLDECRKIIAPLLSSILNENVAVKKETPMENGYFHVEFRSAREYEIETGVAGAAKGGELLSGDSFSMMELGNGKFAVAISDGMGNGERARAESQTALSILQQLLQSGMDEKLAIKSVNSILLLRSPDEIFATIDMALVDLYNAKTTFLKVGSTPSFIKRGKEVFPVATSNLPVGILNDIDFDLLEVELQPGDTLVMMTDGIYDAPGHAVNKELWMKRIIAEIETTDPQEIADCLLETVVRYHHGEIEDDMTVVVARIDPYKPEWATFRWPGFTQMERPRVIS